MALFARAIKKRNTTTSMVIRTEHSGSREEKSKRRRGNPADACHKIGNDRSGVINRPSLIVLADRFDFIQRGRKRSLGHSFPDAFALNHNVAGFPDIK